MDVVKRIAVVGMGKMGLLHASLVNTLPGVKVVAFCEKKWAIRSFAKRIISGVDVVASVDGLSGLDLDGIYVTTPPSTHYTVVREIYSNNLTTNVFVEKPLSSSYSDSRAMVALSRGKGVAMVGYNRRFCATFTHAKAIIEQGTLGKPIAFEAYAYSSDRLGSKRSAVLGNDGLLGDLGCHAIDLALWIFGDLTLDTRMVESVECGQKVVCLGLTAPLGLSGVIRSSYYMNDYRLPEIGLTVRGDKGTLEVNDDRLEMRTGADTRIWHRHDLNDNVGFFLGRSDYYREDCAFVGAISEGRVIDPSFETASKVDEIISSAEEKASLDGR